VMGICCGVPCMSRRRTWHCWHASHEEMLAQLRERGLPLELIEHLRKAPEVLDPNEDPDPYGVMKDISVPPDDTGK
jgi:hypothetical protein